MRTAFVLATSFALSLGNAIPALANCPVINGTYTISIAQDDGTLKRRIRHYTRVERGVTSYTFG